VLYPSGEEEPVPVAELELAPSSEKRIEAFAAGRFSAPGAVARTLVSEKIRGQLTDVMYSMGAGHATFYRHQFKPVLAFLASAGGRILIADRLASEKQSKLSTFGVSCRLAWARDASWWSARLLSAPSGRGSYESASPSRGRSWARATC